MQWLKWIVDYGVIGFLLAISVVALAVVIERQMFFRKVNLSEFKDKRVLELELTSKLHYVATIGSNAPYIGLLGTVLGIMLTFYTMGREGFMDTSKIMIGLALALKATAMGLVVAIPAITLYNFQLRKIREIILRWEVKNGGKGI